MRSSAGALAFLIALGFGGMGTSSALPIFSGDGTAICTIAPGCPHPAVAIVPDDVWQPNNPNGTAAVWISYTETGLGAGTIIPPKSDNVTPTAAFTVALPSGFTRLTLDVWADDTATVKLGGAVIMAANFNAGGYCAAGPIGCLPSTTAHFDAMPLTGAGDILEFDVFQLQGAFGLLYAGELEDPIAATPEPSSILLLGSSLLLIGRILRRAHRGHR